MTPSGINFVHITDTHLGPTPEFCLYDASPSQELEKVICAINALPTTPDFVIHTGDMVEVPVEASYRIAADLFQRLDAPVYYVTGNHDDSAQVKKLLPMGEKYDLDSEERNSYRFEMEGEVFLVLDARMADQKETRGELPESQLQVLRDELKRSSQPLTVFIHFPALRFDTPWADRDMLVTNGETFHGILKEARDQVRAVFLGHMHRGMQVLRDGITYVTGGSTFCQFTSWPGAEEPGFEPICPLYFNLVSLLPEQTIVRQHCVMP